MTVKKLFGLWAPMSALLLLSACGNPSAPIAQSSSSPVAASSPTTASASPSNAASPSPSPIATPSTAPSGSIDLSTCPAPAAGQHPLGAPGPPGAGVHAEPTLDWSGCGSLTLPPGTSRFMTSDNWQLGFAATCPNEL